MSENTPHKKQHSTFGEMLEEQETGEGYTQLAETSKSIFRSKTFWLQVVTLISIFVPQVRAFVATNPVETAAVIAAANTILRFATSGRVSLISSKEDEEAQKGGPGWVPSLVFVAGLAAFGNALPGLMPI